MKAYIITLTANTKSMEAAKRCIGSANIPISIFDAVTEMDAEKIMREELITWNYPWKGEEYDMKAGVKKSAYRTANPLRRVACFLSHYMLWKMCVEKNKPLMILEHDAIFI